MQMKAIRFFTDSAGVLLLGMAMAMFIANWASAGLVPPRDPVFMVSMRTIFWIVGALELSVALICLLGERVWWKAAMILWLGLNFLVYQAAFVWTGGHRSFSFYLESLARAFAITPTAAYLILGMVLLYLLSGGSVSLLWLWRKGGAAELVAANLLKISCPSCGGYISFAIQNLGRKIPCPHCQKETTLHKPENLKMSCFFCKEHIEFPAHAIGEKIPCPHCKMDITLKEPA